MRRTKTRALAGIVGAKQARRLPADITTLRELTREDMMDLGLSGAAADRLSACFLLAREIAAPYTVEMSPLTTPQLCIAYVRHRFADLKHAQQEEMWVVTLCVKSKPISAHKVTVGTLRNSLVHPREVFCHAIADRAGSIIVVHNHPSGDPRPSLADLAVTERLQAAGEVIGIPVLDHIVVGNTDLVSIEEFRASGQTTLG